MDLLPNISRRPKIVIVSTAAPPKSQGFLAIGLAVEHPSLKLTGFVPDERGGALLTEHNFNSIGGV